jgi:hypothetical protein
MEWADGIKASEGQMVANIVSADGSQLVNLGHLAVRGLPVTQSANMRLKRVALWQLHPTDANGYVAAFGIHPSMCETARHVVYRLDWQERTWLIPALAILRGLFKPNRLLLETMFRPQAIYQLCVPGEKSGAEVKVIAPWAHHSLDNLTDPRPLLRWLSHTDSGRRTAASIHSHSVQGRLDIEMPKVSADISIQGLINGQTIYVTRFNINHIHDETFSASGRVAFSADPPHLMYTQNVRSVLGVAASLKVPRHLDGTVALQDVEWAQIEPMVRPRGRDLRTRANLRVIVDGVLLKLAGADWKELNRPGISYQNYVHYYRKWVISGLIHQLLATVAASRQPVYARCPNPFRS